MSWSDDEWDADEAIQKEEKKEVRSEDEAYASEEEDKSPKKAEGKKEDEKKKDDAPKVNEKIVAKDSLADLQLHLQKDVDQLVKLLVPKVKEAKAKGAANKFLTGALNALGDKLTLEEATALHKNCKEMHTKRKNAEKKKEEEERIAKEAQEAAKKAEEAKKNNMMTDEDFFKDFM